MEHFDPIAQHFTSLFILYRVELQNNVSSLNSTLKAVSLLEGFSGPVESLEIVMVTNVSLTLSWSPPSVQNGNISGYSIYVNNAAVSIILGY